MDHRNSARPQVPQRPVAARPPAAEEEYAAQRAQKAWTPSVTGSPRRKKWPFLAVLVGALIILALVGWWLMGPGGGVKQPAGDRYQAVFLDNGQVFFGKLKNVQGEYMILESAYYTKKAEVPEDATDEQKAAIENNVSLSKVGNEIYGPESTMSIRAEQVLFWQNLKSDSKVSQAIENAN